MLKKLLYKYFPPDPMTKEEFQKMLKTLYNDNTHEFEQFFLESYIGNMPKDIREPSIAFLAQGKERMEKWILFMAYAIQSRIETDPGRIQFNQGMLSLLKLIAVHVKQPTRPVSRETHDETQKTVVPDPLDGMNEALNGLYALQKKEDVV